MAVDPTCIRNEAPNSTGRKQLSFNKLNGAYEASLSEKFSGDVAWSPDERWAAWESFPPIDDPQVYVLDREKLDYQVYLGYQSPEFSSDGQFVRLIPIRCSPDSGCAQQSELALLNLATRKLTRVSGLDRSPVWSP